MSIMNLDLVLNYHQDSGTVHLQSTEAMGPTELIFLVILYRSELKG
jgi:hypothetical protein